MGGEHGCAVAKLQVSEVSGGQQGSEVTFEFMVLTSAPGSVQPQDIEDRCLKTSRTVWADAEPCIGGTACLTA
jgi:hypothetical protein